MKHRATYTLNKSLWEAINIDADVILDWVEDNFVPEEVFDTDKLERWANDNDYHQAPDDEPPDREL